MYRKPKNFLSSLRYSIKSHHETIPSTSLGGSTLQWRPNIFSTSGPRNTSGPAKWGNSEFETYTNSNTDIRITKDHTLTITPCLSRGVWTSSRIETQQSDFAASADGQLYIESRIKLALGSNFKPSHTNWPAVSEWDILETVNNGIGSCNETNGLGSGGVPFSRGVWHTVGFMVDRSMTGNRGNGTWLNEALNWYLGGTQVFTVSGKKVGDKKTWKAVAHNEHFLLLNVAVGGSRPGGPNSQTTDGPSVGMEVDYVGVWKLV
ncbi:glycoside hydrolase family 16 protein [Hyaloscypha bicolor E]|uniref:Glycoside hydrolase family 16 protein n=1 Tax=Hyaloscypha bicolor E TaxID=1095630 RepID=A0A2J6THH3_9HELO|nr:glycoside hydrolase family 16 protein [Hyaloscypha bicolor E]PMD62467.1 glycoside hydrolase family 16 protein [Hyaloscypha bicolor E]